MSILKRFIYFGLAGVICLVGLVVFINTDKDNETETEIDSTPVMKQDRFQEDTIEVVAHDDGSINANHLFIPWTINKSGNNIFLSEREGFVIQIDGDFGLVEVQEVDVSESVLPEGEGGFLGFTLAPDFETTKRAFAYHTYQKDDQSFNRIIALKLDENKWKEENVLLEGIPSGELHAGGRIQIGPDDMLYATTGDTGNKELAQELDSLAGKILRMEQNGDIPEDNPFEDSYVFSYGHRNPQGFAWDDKGNLFSSEHGESGNDEINLIVAGGNYGWPVIQGDEVAKNMITPIHHSGEETWAPSGMGYNNGTLYIASLAGSKIFTYDIENDQVGEFFDGAGRLRDVLIDGNALFTITNNHDNRGEPTEKDDRLIHLPLTEKASAN